jgi:hypothetical protein
MGVPKQQESRTHGKYLNPVDYRAPITITKLVLLVTKIGPRSQQLVSSKNQFGDCG